jgi:Zn-dependent protease with chaperone function
VVLTSSLVEKLSKTEIKAVIGHEMGHILFGHVRIICIMSTQIGLGSLLFYKWSRSCEYSADSVALIASKGDLIPMTSSLLKLAWGLDDSVDVEEFLAQLDGDSGTLIMEIFSTHPFMNNRIKNLIRLARRKDFKKKIEHMDTWDPS